MSSLVDKKVDIIGTVVKLKTIVCMACHKYKSNSAGFLDSRDVVRTFDIHKFFTQYNCFNNLFALNRCNSC